MSRRAVIGLLSLLGASLWAHGARADGAKGELRYELARRCASFRAALTYDRARGRVVSFGGADLCRQGETLRETWEWDGAEWARVATEGPSPRRDPALAYDESRGGVVLFGGEGDGGALNDTWLWDGASWRQIDTGETGPRGPVPVLVHDDAQSRLLLLTRDLSAPAQSPKLGLWELGEGGWAKVMQAPTAAVVGASATYDRAGARVVLFGGFGVGGEVDETWELVGTTFTRLKGPGPVGRGQAPMAFDETRARVVLVGGFRGGALLSDLWELDGSTWSKRPAKNGPDGALGQAAASVPGGVMVNGYATVGDAISTFFWDGVEMRSRPVARSVPDSVAGAAMWFDARSGRLAVLGGRGPAMRGDELWLRGEKAFELVASSPRPSPRVHAAVAADATTGQVVIAGGRAGLALDDVWVGDASSFSRAAFSLPSPRHGASAAFTQPGQVVVFGGASIDVDGRDVPSQETLLLGPSGVDVLTPMRAPKARSLAGMVTDERRGVVVLHGGVGEAGVLGDTWEFSRGEWVETTPSVSPPPLGETTLSYDPQRGRVLRVSRGEVWAYDGVSWSQDQVSVTTLPANGHMAAFDRARGELVLLGGVSPAGVWAYQVRGNGCEGDGACATGHCVDGVCCVEAACPLCERCDLPGSEGSCAAVAPGGVDVRCGPGMVCAGAGRCGAALGEPVTSSDECAQGALVDGVCCAEASCEGVCRACDGQLPGQCSAVLGRQQEGRCEGDFACDGAGSCRLREGASCGDDDECGTDRCGAGRCVQRDAYVCDGESRLLGPGGAVTDCGALRCDEARGRCLERCASSGDCVAGHRCDGAGRCVASPVAAGQGCASSSAGGGGLALAALSLLIAARRRRLAVAFAGVLVASSARAEGVRREVVWREVSPHLDTLNSPGIAFDEARRELVVVGGWRFDGATWSADETWVLRDGGFLRLDVSGPGGRLQPGLAFDRGAGQLVAWGGAWARTMEGGLADAWRWDGASWARQQSTLSPQSAVVAYGRAQLVYDSAHDRLVALGAPSSPGRPLRAWAWSGGAWVEAAPDDEGPKNAGTMVFDEGSGEVLMFDGAEASLYSLTDGRWRKLDAKGPSPRIGHFFVYDPTIGLSVLCGGSGLPPDSSMRSDCWGYGGGAFTPLAPIPFTGSAASRRGFGAAFDQNEQEIVLISGDQAVYGAGSTATLGLKGGTTWRRRFDERLPRTRQGAAMGHDEAAGEVLVVGGEELSQGVFEVVEPTTWAWDGVRFRARKSDEAPRAFKSGRMAYDRRRGQMVLVTWPGNGLPETWVRGAAGWGLLSGAGAPSGQENFAIVYDHAHEQLLSFGGVNAGVVVAQTAVLDDGVWRVIAEGGPSARQGAMLAHDRARGETLLFGGLDADGGVLGDFFRWDGAAWRRVEASPSPPARALGGMVYDPRRGRTVLIGGQGAVGALLDVWEWDGERWEQMATEAPYGARTNFSAAYDEARGEVLLFGGRGTTRTLGSAWSYVVVGEVCEGPSSCDRGACVEGRCCERDDCGPCSTCAADGAEGRCAPRAAGVVVPGACDGESACDGRGGCRLARAEPCAADDECATGHCVDKVCCESARCDGECRSCATPEEPGVCAPVRQRPDDSCTEMHICDAEARCSGDLDARCDADAACASRRCVLGLCRAPEALVCGEGEVLHAPGRPATSCSPFRCDSASGCLTTCLDGSDCAAGARCDGSGRCTQALVSESPSCAAGSGPSGGVAAAVIALAVAAARRRARRGVVGRR